MPHEKTDRSVDEIRAWLISALCTELEVEPESIDTSQSLDSFGLDSIVAFTLTGELANWLGHEVQTTLMWDHPTIDALAAHLAGVPDESAPRSYPGVVVLHEGDDRLPVFFLPGIGGHPVSFTPVADHLGGRPVYGLTVPGIRGESEPLLRVEDIAGAMVENVRRVQPDGPYQLAGYSFGGFLAYEMACQLAAADEPVALLAIYDAFAPGGLLKRPLRQRLAMHAGKFVSRPDRLDYLRARVHGLRRRFARPAAAPESDDADQNPTERAQAASRHAASRYEPRPYPGRLVLFRARERADYFRFWVVDPQNGWANLARDGVVVEELPGTHLTVLDPANGPIVGATLCPYLLDD